MQVTCHGDEKFQGRMFTIVLALSILLSLLGVTGLSSVPDRETAEGTLRTGTPWAGDDAVIRTLADGTKYLVHPDELRSGGPGKGGIGEEGGIPALVGPPMIPAAQADYLDEDELVLGLTWRGETRAYPFQILVWHEIVNDVVRGDPLLITWCPLCFTGLAFKARIDGQRELFGVSGLLYNSELVMYDQGTESYWLQSPGKAVVGPRTGLKLSKVPIDVVTWGAWRSAHPESLVVSQETGFARPYGSNPYGAAGDFTDIRMRLGVANPDPRLPAQTIVYGVVIGGSAVAYPDSTVREHRVIIDQVGETPVVVFLDPEIGGPRVYVRRVQGEAVTFTEKHGLFVDRQTGTSWTADGEAVDGPLKGTRLKRLVHEPAFWFAWSAFHPRTEVYAE